MVTAAATANILSVYYVYQALFYQIIAAAYYLLSVYHIHRAPFYHIIGVKAFILHNNSEVDYYYPHFIVETKVERG